MACAVSPCTIGGRLAKVDASPIAIAHWCSLFGALLLCVGGCEREPAGVCERLGALCVGQDVVQRFDAPRWASASADLDGDGAIDLVTALPDLGLVIAWGKERVRDYRTYPGGAVDVGLADLDGDGDTDVLVITGESLRVLENRGGRALPETQVLELEARAESLWVGALDDDARPDAVVATSVRGGLTIFTEGLARRERLEFGADLSAVEVADLDADGHLEIVAADFSDSALYVVPAGGAGEAVPVRSASGPAPEYLQLLDFDGDGRLDAWTHGRATPEIWLHTGESGGSFAPPRAIDALDVPSPGFAVHRDERGAPWVLAGADHRLIASELDADARVVRRVMNGRYNEIASAALDGGVALARGARDFVRYDLAPARMFTELWNGGPRDIETIMPIVLGDFTQDGILDVAAVPHGDDLAIYAGRADGAWGEHATFDIPDSTLWMQGGDVTGDGRLDLVIADSTPAVTIAVGQGDGNFELGPTVPVRVSAWALHTFDPGGTGAAAVALASDSGVDEQGADVLTFDAAGNLVSQAMPITGGWARRLASADVDGDGREELVALVFGDMGVSLVIAPPEGDGWGAVRTRSLADVQVMLGGDRIDQAGLGLGDLDQDGKVDAVLVVEKSIVRLPDFAADAPPPVRIDPLPNVWEADHVVVAHADDDEILDVVIQNYSGLYIALGAEDGALQVQAPFDEFISEASVSVDPVDGHAMAAYSSGRGISVLAPGIAPSLVRVDSFGAPGPAAAVATGDVDGDGRTDIVVGEVPTEYDSGFNVLWGSGEGASRAGTGAAGWGGPALCVAALDDEPGDEIVFGAGSGFTVWTFVDGSLQRSGQASVPVHEVLDVKALARPQAPEDIVVLGRSAISTLELVARPRPDRNDFEVWDEPVALWEGPEGTTPPAMATADFDGDGFSDVALFPGQGEPVQVVWGDAQRAAPVTTLAVDPAQARTLAVGDVDGDGTPEVVVGGEEGTVQVGFVGRKPVGPFAAPRDCGIHRLVLVDFEGDGRNDILCEGWTGPSIALRAPGRADAQVWLWTGDYEELWTSVQAAELDGDGILDLVAVRGGGVVTRLSDGGGR